jgi:hypothetical protein
VDLTLSAPVSQSYAAGVVRIPAAAVSLEDAEAMARMQARGQNITLHLYMEGEADKHPSRTGHSRSRQDSSLRQGGPYTTSAPLL